MGERMKILLGITRKCVGDKRTWQEQRAADMWEIEVPDDGSEFLHRIWMIADGLEVLSLPLTIGPAMTAVLAREHSHSDPA
jgi:hypothetical protein